MLQKLILLEFSYYVKMCVQFQTGVGSTRRGGGGLAAVATSRGQKFFTFHARRYSGTVWFCRNTQTIFYVCGQSGVTFGHRGYGYTLG